MVPPSSTQPQEICPWLLREKFNTQQIVERTERGELRAAPHQKYRPRPVKPNGRRVEVWWNHVVEYFTLDGKRIAVAHCLVDSKGVRRTYPDPKWLLEDNLILIPIVDPNHSCAYCRGRNPNPAVPSQP